MEQPLCTFYKHVHLRRTCMSELSLEDCLELPCNCRKTQRSRIQYHWSSGGSLSFLNLQLQPKLGIDCCKDYQCRKASCDIGGFETEISCLKGRKMVGNADHRLTEFDEMMLGHRNQAYLPNVRRIRFRKDPTGPPARSERPDGQNVGAKWFSHHIDTENTFRPERITQMVKRLSEKHGMELTLRVPPEYSRARAYIPITRCACGFRNWPGKRAQGNGQTCSPANRWLPYGSFQDRIRRKGTLADRQQKLNKAYA